LAHYGRVKNIPAKTVKAQRVVVEATGEIGLYYTLNSEKKLQAMQDSFAEKHGLA
jgi:hypothetical protein